MKARMNNKRKHQQTLLCPLESELNLLFKQHIQESIEISNKIRKHKYFSQREVVIRWMYDICKEEDCLNDVFIQSSNLFDKILVKFQNTNILKIEYLQLIACACLSITSKLMVDQAISNKLSIAKLIFYTDNTYTIEELCDMEMLLIMNINWNINDYYNIYNEYICYYLNNNEQLKSLHHHYNLLHKSILNMFIFNNIFLLNYNVYGDISSNFDLLFLFSLLSIKTIFNQNISNFKFNNKLFSKFEKSIQNNFEIFSFINFNNEENMNEEDENVIETQELNNMFTFDSDSSDCSSGIFTKSSSTSSIRSFI